MMTTPTSNHSANIHSHSVVPAYQQLNKTTTTRDLLSLIRQDCLVIMNALEAEALETKEHHQKIKEFQQEVAQLKRYYLDAIPLFEHDDCYYAA